MRSYSTSEKWAMVLKPTLPRKTSFHPSCQFHSIVPPAMFQQADPLAAAETPRPTGLEPSGIILWCCEPVLVGLISRYRGGESGENSHNPRRH
jgi:hypothetical protein